MGLCCWASEEFIPRCLWILLEVKARPPPWRSVEMIQSSLWFALTAACAIMCNHVTHWLHYQHSPSRQPINKSNHFSQHSCKQDDLIPHLEIIQGECSPCLSCKLSLWSFLNTLYQFWQFGAHDALCRFYHLVRFFFSQQPCSWHIRWYSRSVLIWLYSCWKFLAAVL